MNDISEFQHYGPEHNQNNGDNSDDIVMYGKILYRYAIDQFELEGEWKMSNDNGKERFSYLFLKKQEKMVCLIKNKELMLEDSNKLSYKIGI